MKHNIKLFSLLLSAGLLFSSCTTSITGIYYFNEHKDFDLISKKILVLPAITSTSFKNIQTSNNKDNNFTNKIDNFVTSTLHQKDKFIFLYASDPLYHKIYPALPKMLLSRFGVISSKVRKALKRKYNTPYALIPIAINRPEQLWFEAETTHSKNQDTGEVRDQSSVIWHKGNKVGIKYQIINLDSGEVLSVASSYISDAPNQTHLLLQTSPLKLWKNNFLGTNMILLKRLLPNQ